MDWLIKTVQDLWVEITTGGALAVITYKTFISDVIASKKANRAISQLFSTTTTIKSDVDKSMKSEVAKLLKGLEVVFEQFGEFKPLIEALLSENKIKTEENATLVNLIVQSLSYLNVPVEQKRATFEALKTISSVNETVMESLEASIAKSEKTVVERHVAHSETKEKINRI
jgi:hypothetical protein